MKEYTFNSQFQLGDIIPSFDKDTIKNEPMLFSCDPQYAYQHGGVITRAFLDVLFKNPEFDGRMVIDSRVHMLMPGWFPAIPGFHHDDVPRSKTNGQPNYDNPEYCSKHAFCLVNGDVCPTEFAIGTSEFPVPQDNEKCYKIWHPLVEQKINNGELVSINAPSNQIIYFDWQTWHQGTRAVKNGWRWFIRATINTDRPILNEIRRQVQVYLEKPMEGW